jgi:hypothetical protein
MDANDTKKNGYCHGGIGAGSFNTDWRFKARKYWQSIFAYNRVYRHQSNSILR